MEFLGVQFLIRSFLTLAFLVALTACGASKSGSGNSDLESRSGDEVSNPTKPVSFCNKAGNSSFNFKLMAQYNNGSYDPNWAHLRIYNAPAGFDTSATYIQFWKAYASSDSLVAYHSSPISFSVYDLQTQKYVKNDLTALRWDEVKDLFSGASVTDFMARAMFVLNLQDPNGQYTVFTATAYAASNNQTQVSVNALIPAFYANPADYATKANGFARETVLRNMHPLRNQTSNFEAQALALCQ